jgi:C4-dicarboxylate-specific signal transduction histidine kinase
MTPEPGALAEPPARPEREAVESPERLRERVEDLERILGDYERDRSRLARQSERLSDSRRALLNILKDSHGSNLRLEASRKAMIHIMGDLRETTAEMERREQELRDKQEQLVQAAKLATLGELTTGVAHELNNPLNNIGLYIGNAIDKVRMARSDGDHLVRDLEKALEQVGKATEIISHLRTFGRTAPVAVEAVSVNEVVERALSLMQEQLRLRQITVRLVPCDDEPVVFGNAIQLEQVFINLLTNARDAVEETATRSVEISCVAGEGKVRIWFADSGAGIPAGLEQRIFDPFFTTKDVGQGTGLGLSIAYGIVNDHGGTISLESHPGEGARFLIELPLAGERPPERAFL